MDQFLTEMANSVLLIFEGMVGAAALAIGLSVIFPRYMPFILALVFACIGGAIAPVLFGAPQWTSLLIAPAYFLGFWCITSEWRNDNADKKPAHE